MSVGLTYDRVMTTARIESEASLSACLANELHAEMGRRRINQVGLAHRMGRTEIWVSRRLGRMPKVDMTLAEVEEMSDALGVDAERVVVAALRARRDSNPKPSDLYLIRGGRYGEGGKGALTLYRPAPVLRAVGA